MTNTKYEITNMTHENDPFLRRIRALRDIGSEVKAGDLGGFVERTDNLSFQPRDDSWIFDDAIARGGSCVEQDSVLRDNAVICDLAHVADRSVLSGQARVEGRGAVLGARLMERALVTDGGKVMRSAATEITPELRGACVVRGVVMGNFLLCGTFEAASGMEYLNTSPTDTIILRDTGRDVLRIPDCDLLTPTANPRSPRFRSFHQSEVNSKFELTDIAHEKYPFLRRIRALRDIGSEVKAGDLGGFVERAENLSFKTGDDSWIFDSAIACGCAVVWGGSVLRNHAAAREDAEVCGGAILREYSRAEGGAYVCGAQLSGRARVSFCGQALCQEESGQVLRLSDESTVYGHVNGNVELYGKTVVIQRECLVNLSREAMILRDGKPDTRRVPGIASNRTPQQASGKKKAERKGAER